MNQEIKSKLKPLTLLLVLALSLQPVVPVYASSPDVRPTFSSPAPQPAIQVNPKNNVIVPPPQTKPTSVPTDSFNPSPLTSVAATKASVSSPIPPVAPASEATRQTPPVDNTRGQRPSQSKIPPPPAELGFDPKYRYYLDVEGISVVGLEGVLPEAMYEVRNRLRTILRSLRPDVRQALADLKMYISIYPDNQIHKVPEYLGWLGPEWDDRAQGLGPNGYYPANHPRARITSISQLHILKLPGNRYTDEDIFCHEFKGHAVNLAIMRKVNPGLDGELRNLWQRYKLAGKLTPYEATDPKGHELFAEGVQDISGVNNPKDPTWHRPFSTLEGLKTVRPELFALLSQYLSPTGEWPAEGKPPIAANSAAAKASNQNQNGTIPVSTEVSRTDRDSKNTNSFKGIRVATLDGRDGYPGKMDRYWGSRKLTKVGPDGKEQVLYSKDSTSKMDLGFDPWGINSLKGKIVGYMGNSGEPGGRLPVKLVTDPDEIQWLVSNGIGRPGETFYKVFHPGAMTQGPAGAYWHVDYYVNETQGVAPVSSPPANPTPVPAPGAAPPPQIVDQSTLSQIVDFINQVLSKRIGTGDAYFCDRPTIGRATGCHPLNDYLKDFLATFGPNTFTRWLNTYWLPSIQSGPFGEIPDPSYLSLHFNLPLKAGDKVFGFGPARRTFNDMSFIAWVTHAPTATPVSRPKGNS